MNVYLLIGLVIWAYVLSVLKRAQLPAFAFIVGSAGLFFVLISLADPYWIWFATHAVINGVRWFGDLTGWSSVMTKYGMVSIHNATVPVTMVIDYECSGIIETAAFLSLVVFFPIFNQYERVFFSVFGVLWIYAANVIRLATVIVIVHFGGGQLYFLAHSILGRLIFYVLVIVLYYNVFTFSQISHSLYLNFQAQLKRLRRKEPKS
ncbi:exosortase family protein XrtG [Lactiplantibacillus garii]|uniref:Exosortase family protein XrtG n=1 Tax=Lactiplantibacillus garii TaxID=2306423 RepID=A0A426DAE4_9LACO|nr:exosortase family protein XrtG [Lactiplantibacillus garii]RRK11674.1 exosortase family protein XrtG [Lactiplantibacillus garii]